MFCVIPHPFFLFPQAERLLQVLGESAIGGAEVREEAREEG